MKGRGKINLAIDLLMFLTFTLIGGIGFLIKYTLPPGRELILKFGENSKLFFLGLDRHQWGTIHLTAAYILIGLLVLHIIFHWKAIGVLISQSVPSLFLRRLLVAGFAILGSGLLLFSFLIKPQKSESDNFLHRNSSFNKVFDPESASGIPEISNQTGIRSMGKKPGELNGNEQQGKTPPEPQEKHGEREKADSLQGKMSIADASRLYGISTLEVKKRLRIPDEVSDNETIGRLRRPHGFTMAQARERLEKKQ